MVTTIHKPVLIVIAGPNGSGKTTIIYDNSVDNQEACLLFRMVNGKVYKRYVEDLPNWAYTIIS
ncbi:MAG: hypothetical protein ACI3ZB_10060 [Prevotella sp.]